MSHDWSYSPSDQSSQIYSPFYDRNTVVGSAVTLSTIVEWKEDTTEKFTDIPLKPIDIPLQPINIPNWPEPISPKRSSGRRTLDILQNLLFLIPPLFFIVLIASAIYLQSRYENDFGERVRQTCLLGPTLFPICFATIVGWSLKIYGRYKSERGVKLGYLERVIGSQTLVTSLKYTFQLKAFDALGVILLLLWCLSPLGGQSILRMLSTTKNGPIDTEPVGYLNPYAESDFVGASTADYSLPAANGLYVSSLFSPFSIKSSPTDLWGSIKIPFSDAFDPTVQETDWIDFVYNDQQNYTSLLGIPVNTTFNGADQSTFIFNTTSFTSHCDQPNRVNISSVPQLTTNMTFLVQTQYDQNVGTQREISLITYPVLSGDTEYAVIHNCTLTVNLILAEVGCQLGNCTIKRMKKIADSDGQISNLLLSPVSTWDNLLLQLPASTGLPHPAASSQTETYLYDPAFNQGNSSLFHPDLSQVPIDEFNKRFTTVINTYYQATIAPQSRLGIPDGTIDLNRGDVLQIAAASVTQLSNTYVCQWAWIICGLIASIAMLIAAIIGIILENGLMAPDIFGYVSSLTRDNPYFVLPPSGCMLDGFERTILMKDVVVRLEDVAPNERVGHVAFTMAKSQERNDQQTRRRLRLKRLYAGIIGS